MERIMTIRQVSAKIDTRLNKGASGDYDNLWPAIKKEAFNKAILDMVRNLLRGKDGLQDGDEETTMRVDDLQILITSSSIGVRDKGLYAQTSKLPSDYLYYKRLTPIVSSGNCSNIQIKSHLREEANVDDLMDLPSFEFEETFNTLIGNRSNIYHNKKFTVEKVILTYYRKPMEYDFKKLDTVIEFGDGVCELFVDEACKIIASDLEILNQKVLSQERVKEKK